jgi:hypothetical protein
MIIINETEVALPSFYANPPENDATPAGFNRQILRMVVSCLSPLKPNGNYMCLLYLTISNTVISIYRFCMIQSVDGLFS